VEDVAASVEALSLDDVEVELVPWL